MTPIDRLIRSSAFEYHAYSTLVLSSSGKTRETLRALLSSGPFDPIAVVDNIAKAKRAVLDNPYDLIIVDTPLSDGFGDRFAIDLCNDSHSACLLLARSEHYEDVYAKVVHHGVFTMQKPISSVAIVSAMEWMIASRERLRKLEKKAVSVEEKMEEIRLVNRAKRLLIDNLKMTESDAHRYIEKQAMNQCVSKREIAQGILRTYHQ
ncbi:MAG: ANTAR domain-containing protein [Coriobacteriales bacterium]|nr:ANTAR domain-containing protein [Coriobacteriales bacterium]